MTRPQSRSFRNRLLLSFLIASLAPMIICSAMLSQISRIQMTKQLDTDAQTQTAQLMTALDRISDALPGAARALEESRLLPRAFTSREDTQINTALFLATEGSRDLADYSLYDLRGSLRYSTGSVTAGTTLSTRWGVLFAAKNAGGQAVYQAPMDGGKTLLQGAALVLSAHTDLPLVRNAVQDAGYHLVREEICRAAGRYYIVWKAEPGPAAYTPQQLRLGPLMMDGAAPLLAGYLRWRCDMLEDKLRGLRAASRQDDSALQEISSDLAVCRRKLEALS